MPALPSYIPNKDADLMNWMSNFSSLVSAAPGAYGLTTADALTIAGVTAVYLSQYTPVTSKTTKTAEAVQTKNTGKVVALASLRPYAQQIALNQGVSSGAKIALGLNPRTSVPTPVTAPVTSPVLTFQSAGNLCLILRYRDSAAGVSVKAKPYGVVSCELYAKASATPITDAALLLHAASATKSPLQVVRDPGEAGQQLYVAGRWKTRKGEYGPWSPIVNMTVPATK